MSLSQTGGSGTLVGVGIGAAMVYTATGAVTATGSGDNNLVLVGSDFVVSDGSTIALAALTADAVSQIEVLNGSTVDVTGIANAGALNNYVIGTGGTLGIGPGVALSIGQTIAFSDATGTLVLPVNGLAVNILDHITGFQPGDTISLQGGAYTTTGSSYDPASGQLTLIGTGGSPDIVLSVGLLPGLALPEYFSLTVQGGMTVVSLGATDTSGIPACYVRGTMLQTDKGEVAVELLTIGDRLVTASGGSRPIRWIGSRHYNGRFLASDPRLLPVRICKGALGNGLPHRDLLVSPRHAMFLDGYLVPASCLVNGTTILGGQRADQVHYYHVELEEHDVVVAEGCLAESYVEDYNRGMFHNAASFAERYPQAQPKEAAYCAPRVENGFELEAIRNRISQMAETLAMSA